MHRGEKAVRWEPFRGALDALLSVVFPAPCHICREPLVTASRIPICQSCLGALRRIDGPICRKCGRPFRSREAKDAEVCHACEKDVYRFDLARSYGLYDSAMERILVLLKHQPIAPLGAWLAARLAETLGKEQAVAQVDWLVPVPLDRKRLRTRGYNQIDLIAQPLGRRLGLPLQRDALERLRSRPNRQKLSRRERWETVRGAFVAGSGKKMKGARILLVDDVLTSGATLDACARALHAAGARAVHAVTVARVMPFWEPADYPEAVIESEREAHSASERR